MEQRLSAVEQAIVRLDTRLEHIDREVSQGKWFILGSTLTVVLTVFATGIGIQQMTVATFQGAAQQQKDSQPAPQPPAPIIINVPAAGAAPAQPASR